MKRDRKLWIALFCVALGIAGVIVYQGYTASIQASTVEVEERIKITKKKKKAPAPSPTYAPLRNKTMVVKSRAYEKKVKDANKEIKSIRTAIKKNKKQIDKLKEHRREAKRIMGLNSDDVDEELKDYIKKYNASEYNNNVGYSMYVDLQDDYMAKEETLFGDALQTMALSMGNVAVSDTLEEDVKNVDTRIDLFRSQIREQRSELKSVKKKKKKVVKYINMVFDSSNIFLPSNVDKKSLKYALSGTELEPLAGAFLQAEKEYGVNAIALVGIAAHESAWGTSRRARYDNNLTGFGVYSDSSSGINGKTKTANILRTAKCLATRYAEPGQSYFHGTGLLGVNRSYAASKTWAARVEGCGITVMEKIAECNQ